MQYLNMMLDDSHVACTKPCCRLRTASAKLSFRQEGSTIALFLLLSVSLAILGSTSGVLRIGLWGKEVVGRLLPVTGTARKTAHHSPISALKLVYILITPSQESCLSHSWRSPQFPFLPAFSVQKMEELPKYLPCFINLEVWGGRITSQRLYERA